MGVGGGEGVGVGGDGAGGGSSIKHLNMFGQCVRRTDVKGV